MPGPASALDRPTLRITREPLPMATDVIAIVPAGGRSRRMGKLVGPGGKAALELGGRSLVERVCGVLAAETGRVVVVAAAGQPLPRLPRGVEVIRDRRPAAGPLAAIHDALVHVAGGPQIAVVASCDLPGLRPAVVRLLVAAAREPGVRWAVPLVGGHPQVLVSALNVDLEPTIAAALAAGERSPRAVLSRLAAAEPAAVRSIDQAALAAVDPGLASFADVDAPEDLARPSPGTEPAS